MVMIIIIISGAFCATYLYVGLHSLLTGVAFYRIDNHIISEHNRAPMRCVLSSGQLHRDCP